MYFAQNGFYFFSSKKNEIKCGILSAIVSKYVYWLKTIINGAEKKMVNWGNG